MSERAVIILAAGEGTRMKSPLPKVLHPVNGRPLVTHVLDAAHALGLGRPVVVVGYGRDQERAAIANALGFSIDEIDWKQEVAAAR